MTNNKYYDNYDINITNIKGSGAITPTQPANRNKTTDTITNTFKKEVNFIPPLYEITNRGNKIENDAYVNKNNYVIKNNNTKDNYYTSQHLNNKINLFDKNQISKKELEKLNKEAPIKIPPPLINTPIKNNNLKKEIINDVKDRIKKIKNNSFFNNNYIYTFEPNNTNYINDANNPWETYKYFFPKLKNYNYYPDNINLLSNNDYIESFNNVNKSNINENYNFYDSFTFYLIILIIILLLFLYNNKK